MQVAASNQDGHTEDYHGRIFGWNHVNFDKNSLEYCPFYGILLVGQD